MADTGSIRAFLAADPPPEILERIAAIQRELKKTVQGSIAWVRPEGIHLTLKFMGDISHSSVEVVRKAVIQACADLNSFEISVSGRDDPHIRPEIEVRSQSLKLLLLKDSQKLHL